MFVRLGYVAISLNLKDSSTSKTVTLSTLSKINDSEKRLYKLKSILSQNLDNVLRILRYNVAYNISVYRLSSKLVPLATHPIIDSWNYIEEFKPKFKEIGDFIKQNNLRISAHPDHYTIINSMSEQIFENSIKDLKYLNNIFEAMELDDTFKLVIHVGGKYGDKEKSIQNFVLNFKKLPPKIANRIVLENDDKTYNVTDVLNLCNKLSIPMVLDVHHHNCNNNGENIQTLLQDIFNTWNNQKVPPKIHFSSPKNEHDYRSHADNINPQEFIQFLDIAKSLDMNFDVIIEAKNKDVALFNLSSQIESFENINFINKSSFYY